MENIVVRNARAEDAQALLDIYSYYVKNTAISFEYECRLWKNSKTGCERR